MAKPGENSLFNKFIGVCEVCKQLMFFTLQSDLIEFNTEPFCSEGCAFISWENLPHELSQQKSTEEQPGK